MNLDELRVYQLAMAIGEEVWELVKEWGFFEKDTVGKQWVRAADSMAANLSEGFGRYHFKENRNFCHYARGSLFETRTWLKKAGNRNLIPEPQGERLSAALDDLAIRINNYIRSIGPVGVVKEPESEYGLPNDTPH